MPILDIKNMKNGRASIEDKSQENIIEKILIDGEALSTNENKEIQFFTIPTDDIKSLFLEKEGEDNATNSQ